MRYERRNYCLHLVRWSVLLLFISFPVYAGIPSPDRFLGHEAGERFTQHHELVSYFKEVARLSPHVSLISYGTSYQGRPMVAAVIGSRENLAEMETIRLNNRRMAGLEKGEIQGKTAAVAWMSYGIHGNESSGPEAAMYALYSLATGKSVFEGIPMPDSSWKDHAIVLIDPVLNPDGRERYVQWYTANSGRRADPRAETREHNEPWPGGRTNHYYMDLNRDWVWQTQKESRERARLYMQWLPHVHADFHEMGEYYYFFAPAARPFHEAITDWQREFQEYVGSNHAHRFNRRHELYFTGEIFDLVYPGFGDTWPIFNGAVGMTYEQMGHGRAGTKLLTAYGDTLTLSERIINQYEISLSTVEVTARHAHRLKEEFIQFFKGTSSHGEKPYASYVIGAGNHPDRMKALTGFLDRQEIHYYSAVSENRMTGLHYSSGRIQSRRTSDGDLVIPVDQPKSVLTRVLFDPVTELADSNTYDITAWALPYAYGLEAWASVSEVPYTSYPVWQFEEGMFPYFAERFKCNSQGFYGIPEGDSFDTALFDDAFAFLFHWSDVRDAALAAALFKQDIRFGINEAPMTFQGCAWPSGSIVITRRANRHLDNRLGELVRDLAMEHQRPIQVLQTGRSDSGPDLASPRIHPLKRPVVAAPAGPGVHPNRIGEIWHFFDYRLDYPLALFDPARFSSFPLEDYNLLILPDGHYGNWKDSDLERLLEWVKKGGRIIAMAGGVRFLSGLDEMNIRLRSYDSENETESDSEERRRFEDRRRHEDARRIGGAVFQVEMDDSHPLAYGLGPLYLSLKTGTTFPEKLEKGWNVGILGQEGALLSGLAGEQALDLAPGSLMAGTLSLGEGQIVILADQPIYRGFWRNGELLLGNAIFRASIAR